MEQKCTAGACAQKSRGSAVFFTLDTRSEDGDLQSQKKARIPSSEWSTDSVSHHWMMWAGGQCRAHVAVAVEIGASVITHRRPLLERAPTCPSGGEGRLPRRTRLHSLDTRSPTIPHKGRGDFSFSGQPLISVISPGRHQMNSLLHQASLS